MFHGRDGEFGELKASCAPKRATLIVCRGRRRIGKSRLIHEFGRQFPRFLSFEGLAPQPSLSEAAQLTHFGEALSRQSTLPALNFRSWQEALTTLASETKQGKVLILLDEISWLASANKNFPGILKAAWDTQLSQNPNLALVICGSVSSWIEANILNNAGFVGRIALDLNVGPLPLPVCTAFWGKRASRVAPAEIFRVLAVTGAIPRYLEEIRPNESAEKNIKRLCFTPSGLLFNEFERIFDDVFRRRSPTYQKITRTLVSGRHTFVEICEAMKMTPNGVITSYLSDLCESGFLAHDHVYSLKTGKPGRLSTYRIADSYIRFYLKYIHPQRSKIARGLFRTAELERLPGYDTIMGFQLESLVLNQLPSVLTRLGIAMESLISAGPFFQNKTQRQKACQIDLLIHTKRSVYVCEIKFRHLITAQVIGDVKEKLHRLKVPRGVSMRPILIHLGELAPALIDADYFDQHLDVAELLR